MQTDDLIIVAYCCGDADNAALNTAMITAGYTEVADLDETADAQDSYLGVFYKFWNGSDTTAVVDGLGGADTSVVAVCQIFRGVELVANGGPFTQAATTDHNIDSANPNPPSIDHPGTAGTWTVIAGGCAHLSQADNTFTFPTGYTTNAVDRGQSATETTYATVGMGYNSSPSDPEDPGVMTHANTAATNSWCAVTMALMPYVPPATLDQPHFRIRTDDSQTLNADAGWANSLDLDATIDAETIFRIRFEVATTGNAASKTYKLQYRRNGGTWTDVPVNTAVPPTSVDATEIVLSAQYADDDATTNILSGSGLTFSAGVGLEDNLTPSISLNNQHTEYEWALRIRITWNNGTSRGKNADGDTFEYRVVFSDGTAFGGTYEIPVITLNIPNYLIGATTIETPKRMGPFKDANGNLYFYVEYGEPNASDEPAMLKSTDGGKQWSIMDAANAPTTAQGADDNESIDIQQVGSVLHIGAFHGSGRIKYHTFRTSDNASPDTWGTVSQEVHTATTATDQDVTIGVRSDGSIVCVYQTDGGTLGYRIRSTGGTWGSESILDTTGGVYFSSATVVIGASDLAYIFYKDDTNNLGYYKTLDTGGTLSGRTQVNTTGTLPQVKAFPMAYYFDDGGTETIVVFTRRNSGEMWERRIIGGSLQTERQVSDGDMASNQNGSGAPEGAIVVYGDDIHAAWVDFTDTSLVKYDTSQDGAAYGTDSTKYDSAITGLSIQGANVFRHSAGNGGALVMAVVVDEGDSYTGGNRYLEWTVSETAGPNVVTSGQLTLDVTAAAIAVAPQRALQRASDLAVTTADVLVGRLVISPRAAALDATAAIGIAGQHEVPRAAALDATADIITAGTVPGAANPYKVQNLVATAVSTSQINLSWDDVAALSGEAFDIERNGVVILEDYTGTHSAGSPYPDQNLDPATEYTYRVRAVGGTVV